MTAGVDLTVTIVSYNTRALLAACLATLKQGAQRVTMEIHVVDNASVDGSTALLELNNPNVRLISNTENVGFTRANNQSWNCARGRYWLLLNSDTEVKPGALDALVDFMDNHPRAGLATARLVNLDGTPQHCAQPVPSVLKTLAEAVRLHKLLPRGIRGRLFLGPYWSYREAMPLGWTWSTALIARRSAVEQCGPLSESFFVYGDDIEWCLRLRRQGWEIWFCPDAEVLHHGGGTPLDANQAGDRLGLKLDAIYKAIAAHRGRWYAELWQAANLLGLASAWFGAKCRGRSGSAFSGAWQYHRRQVGRTLRNLLA